MSSATPLPSSKKPELWVGPHPERKVSKSIHAFFNLQTPPHRSRHKDISYIKK